MIIPEYADSVALIPGSSSSIGFETAAQLAEAGVRRVMLNGRDAARGAAAVERLKARVPGTEVDFVRADVVDPDEAKRLVDACIDRFGQIDTLVNAIGGTSSPKPFHQLSREEIRALAEVNFLSPVWVCQAALPHMMAREGGTIVNIASDAAKVATPGESMVGATKAAVLMFSRTLALEASRSGIRVHCLTPSLVVNTGGYDRVMAHDFSKKLFEKAAGRARLGVARPEDVAAIATFLAGPQAARITGQGISINGGISAA